MKSCIADRKPRHLQPRQSLSAADLQHLWRISSGTMRIDSTDYRDEASKPGFVRLACKGDLVGMDELAGVSDVIEVNAITPVVLEPVSFFDDNQLLRFMMEHIAITHRRCREIISLRTGTADERVKRLLHMLADSEGHANGDELACTLPSLGNMADILNLTRETVCRILTSLREAQFLEDCNPDKIRRKHLENREHRLRNPTNLN